MNHKFAQFLHLSSTVRSFSNVNLVRWLECLLEQENGASIVIDSIFSELYNRGEENSDEFLQNLVKKANQLKYYSSSIPDATSSQELQSKEEDCKIDYISNIPDPLLSSIASYLSTKDFFTRWNHVSHKFIQIGLKSETIQYLDLVNVNTLGKLEENGPKFKLDPILTNLKSIKLTSVCTKLFSLETLRMPRNVECNFGLGHRWQARDEIGSMRSNNRYIKNISLSNVDFSDWLCLQKIFLQRHHNIEQISLVSWDFDTEQDSNQNKQFINDILQLLVPLSPEKQELKERLNNEITKDMRNKLQIWEIENLENKIKEEINLKYNKFDENELTMDINDNGCNKVWHSKIKMLYLDDWDATPEAKQLFETPIREQMTEERIKTGLSMLECIAFWDSVYDCGLIHLTIKPIIDTIGSQLTSLHIDDMPISQNYLELEIELKKQFFLLSNPCTKESTRKLCKQSWFPQNIKKLCLFAANEPETENTLHLWHKVNRYTFPNLKHLRIENTMDISNINYIFNSNNNHFTNNISSLIENGLKSLHFKFDRLEFKDLYNDYNWQSDHTKCPKRDPISLAKFFGHIEEAIELTDIGQDNDRHNLGRTFVLKIEFDIDAIEAESIDDPLWSDFANEHCKSNKLLSFFPQISELYLALLQCFDSIMICFKININVAQYRVHIEHIQKELLKTKKRKILVSDKTKTVCAKVLRDGTNDEKMEELTFAFAITANSIAKTRDLCYMDPKYEFECIVCQSETLFEGK